MVRALNVHRYPHRRCVRDEWMCRVICRNDQARAHRLLAQMILQNSLLYALHDFPSKIANHGKIHSGVHQAERVSRRHNAIELRQLFKASAGNSHFRMSTEFPARRFAKFHAPICQNQLHRLADIKTNRLSLPTQHAHERKDSPHNASNHKEQPDRTRQKKAGYHSQKF